ncbi:9451_t:CDS:10 [Ambispora gerdemannii]|uniref:9451_t:CDS:1 n=1 Tax=Ambispora gerdemannii TaxID=144530 RepID=A0A9N9AZB4_9GLOM|nr:9451_t:CDS:10 [Ambispora gerdemannii]
MAGFFAETPLEIWSLDGLSVWCALNVTCDKKKLLDRMKKAIQDIRDAPFSDVAKMRADSHYGTVGRLGVELLSWKLAKNKSDYFKSLQELRKIKDEETIRLTQIKSHETIQLAEIKSKNLQEHTSTVVDFHRNIAIDLTTINNRKRKEIPAYEDEELTPPEDDNKVSKITKIDHHFVHAVTPSPLDKNEHDTDFEAEQDVDNIYCQELSLVETSLNLAIGRLAEIKSGIGRYRIIFLPEDNVHNPIKRLFNDEEWSIMESNWEKVEKRIADSLPQIDENVKLLLEKYSKCIRDATIKCYVDLNKVESIICKSPFEDQHLYLFERDYHLRWVQSVYNAFILCLQTPFNPLGDPDTSEYAYRSRVINYIWEGLFFDCIYLQLVVKSKMWTEKKQLDLSRNLNQRKSSLGTWYHDAVLVMKVGSKLVQIVFGEVIGNAFKRDDKKYNDDKEKMLKAMQLALFNLRKSLPEKALGLEDLETFGLLVYRKEFLLYSMHWVDGIYLVDQFNGFTIPDTSLDLENLSNIIQIMIKFKDRIMKLQAHMEFLYKSSKNFKRGGSQRTNDSIVYATNFPIDSLKELNLKLVLQIDELRKENAEVKVENTRLKRAIEENIQVQSIISSEIKDESKGLLFILLFIESHCEEKKNITPDSLPELEHSLMKSESLTKNDI